MDFITQKKLEQSEKSMVAAYALWLFAGVFAAHRFYLGRTKSAWTYVILFWVGLFLLYFVLFSHISVLAKAFLAFIFTCPIIATFIWHFIDTFLIIRMVRKSNIELYDNYEKSIKSDQ